MSLTGVRKITGYGVDDRGSIHNEGMYLTTPAPGPTQPTRSWASCPKGKAAGESKKSSPAPNVKFRVHGWSVTSSKYGA